MYNTKEIFPRLLVQKVKNIGLFFCRRKISYWQAWWGVECGGEMKYRRSRSNLSYILPVAFTLLKATIKNNLKAKYFWFILFPVTTKLPLSLMVSVGLKYWWWWGGEQLNVPPSVTLLGTMNGSFRFHKAAKQPECTMQI